MEDIVAIGSNGLWDNLGLDRIHYEIKGPNSYKDSGKEKFADAVGREERESKSLQEMAHKVGNLAAFCSRRGNY
jgi:hypothetical protein